MRQKLIDEMLDVFGDDIKRINHPVEMPNIRGEKLEKRSLH